MIGWIKKSGVLTAGFWLAACGQSDSSGFLSDHNYCTAAMPAVDASETISGEATLAVPGTRTDGQSTLAQRGDSLGKDIDIWGLQLRLGKSGNPTTTVTVELWQELKAGDVLYGSGRTSPDGISAGMIDSLKIKPENVPGENLAWVTFELSQVRTLIHNYNQWILFNPPYSESTTDVYTTGSIAGSKSAKYNFSTNSWVVSEDAKLEARWIPCQ